MSNNIYKTPESELIKEADIRYKHKLIKLVLIVMLFTKIFALNLTMGLVFPVSIEGVTRTVNYFLAGHHIIYFLVSTICVIGYFFKHIIFLYAMFFLLLVNIGVYIVNGTLVYQAILDPVLSSIFLLLVFIIKPNKWYLTFFRKHTQYAR